MTALALALTAALLAASPARAVEAVNVRLDVPAIDLTAATDRQKSESDRIQVSTAPGADGIVRRIEVRAREGGNNWAVFALANNGDEQIDRLLVAPHFRLVGSGLFWPDLGASRIATITPSQGFAPDRQHEPGADVFRITLDPGAVVTFVAELRTAELPQLYLWDRDAYKDAVNSYTLYRGIVLGISGLLALFLTIVFVVKGTAMFPATAALAWAVLIYLCIDFGFWNKVFDIRPGADQIWRAGAEVFFVGDAAHLHLHLSQPQPLARALQPRHHRLADRPRRPPRRRGHRAVDRRRHRAPLDRPPSPCSALALIIYLLATHGYDRAIMLIPTWVLLLVWTCAAGLRRHRHRHQRRRPPGAAGGLVLIVLLIGFTVMQHAFAGGVTHGTSATPSAGAGADRRRRHRLGLGRVRATASTPARRPNICSA